MIILGIDYGRKKVGVAIGNEMLAEPLMVIRYNDKLRLIQMLCEIVEKEKVDLLVVGVSEGSMATESKAFGEELSEVLGIRVDCIDETFSTKKAQQLAIDAGIKRIKRKNLEDAYAATILLQEYIDGLASK